MIVRYIDLSTMTVLDKDKIVSNDVNGIVYYDNYVWKFIPADKIRTEKVENETVPINIERYTKELSSKKVTDPLKPDLDESVTHTFYGYYFGLSEATAALREYYENSSFVSDPILTEPGEIYALDADYVQPYKTSVEFYIIDGIKEIPILPLGKTSIQNEKLFFNMPLRFSADDSPIIYRDFVAVADTLESVSFNTNSLLTANYAASEKSQYIRVTDSFVRVKAILRCYKGAEQPPMIKSMILQKGE